MPQTRISDWGHQTLRSLAKDSGMSSEQLLDRALDLLERQRTLEQINEGYAALRADPVRWGDEEVERELWSHTLGDGALE